MIHHMTHDYSERINQCSEIRMTHRSVESPKSHFERINRFLRNSRLQNFRENGICLESNIWKWTRSEPWTDYPTANQKREPIKIKNGSIRWEFSLGTRFTTGFLELEWIACCVNQTVVLGNMWIGNIFLDWKEKKYIGNNLFRLETLLLDRKQCI